MVHVGKYTSPMDAVEICLLYTCNTAIHFIKSNPLVEQFNIQEEYSHVGAFTQKLVLETYIGTIPKSVPLDAVYTYIYICYPSQWSQSPFSGEVSKIQTLIFTF